MAAGPAAGRATAPLLALVAPALLAAAAGGPLDAVQSTLSSARTVVMSDGVRNEKLESLRVLARDLLDTRTMGRRAMGPTLSAQPLPQQEEFLELFDEFIVRRYLQKLLFFREPEFAYVGEEVQGDHATVYTKILTRKDQFTVDYRMRRRSGRWLATDFEVEGVSFIDNYRAQFVSVLRTRSFDELLDLMRRKVEGLRRKTQG